MGLRMLLHSNAPPSSFTLPSSSTANQPRCFLSRIVATRPPAVMAWTAPTGTGPGPDCCTDDLRPLEEPEPLGFGTKSGPSAASSYTSPVSLGGKRLRRRIGPRVRRVSPHGPAPGDSVPSMAPHHLSYEVDWFTTVLGAHVELRKHI